MAGFSGVNSPSATMLRPTANRSVPKTAPAILLVSIFMCLALQTLDRRTIASEVNLRERAPARQRALLRRTDRVLTMGHSGAFDVRVVAEHSPRALFAVFIVSRTGRAPAGHHDKPWPAC